MTRRSRCALSSARSHFELAPCGSRLSVTQENGGLLALLEGKGDSSDIQAKAKALWANVGKTVELLESKLQPGAVYLLGDQISLAEWVALSLLFVLSMRSRSADLPTACSHSLHCGAWLARVLACAGATSITDTEAALKQLEANLDVKVGPKFAAWAQSLFERDSFKEVYGEDGLH